MELHEKYAREIFIDLAKKGILDVWHEDGQYGKESDALGLAENIVQEFIEFTPPGVVYQEAEGEHEPRHIIQIPPDKYRVPKSVKPGNILLNIGELFEAVSNAVFLVISVVAAPWAIPFAIVKLCREISRCIQITLREQDAAVAWTIWRHKDADNSVHVNDLLALVNEEFEKHGRPSISEHELNDSLEKLETIKCIIHPKGDLHRWKIRERVVQHYA